MIGNAWSGGSDFLVVEADESDGTLVKYRPEVSVILNVSKDHKSVDEITAMFAVLASRPDGQSRMPMIRSFSPSRGHPLRQEWFCLVAAGPGRTPGDLGEALSQWLGISSAASGRA